MTLDELIRWDCTRSFPASAFRKFCNGLETADKQELAAEIGNIILDPNRMWGLFLVRYTQIVGLNRGMDLNSAKQFKEAILKLFESAETPAEQLRFFQISSQYFWLGRDTMTEDGKTAKDKEEKPWDPWISHSMRSWWDVPIPASAPGDQTQPARALHRYMALMTGTDAAGNPIAKSDLEVTKSDRAPEHRPAFQFLIERLTDRDQDAVATRSWDLVPDPKSRQAPTSTWKPSTSQRFKRWFSGKCLIRELPPAAARWKTVLIICWTLIGLTIVASVFALSLPPHP